MTTPAWFPDELDLAGSEHLDADYVAGYDRKAGTDPADDLAHLHYPFGVRRQDWQADLPRMLEVWGDAPAATDAEVAGAGDGAEAAADGTGVVEVGDVRVRGARAAADDVVAVEAEATEPTAEATAPAGAEDAPATDTPVATDAEATEPTADEPQG